MSVENNKKRAIVLFALALILPALLVAETSPEHAFFTVIPPLDIINTNQEILTSAPFFPNRAGKRLDENFSSKFSTSKFATTIVETSGNLAFHPDIQGPGYNHNWMNSAAQSQFNNYHIFYSSLGYYFERLFLQFQIAHLFQNTPGILAPLPTDSLISELSIGWGMGQKPANDQYSGQHNYPVTMLVGLKSRYVQDQTVQGEKFSGKKNHLLYFTPGMSIEGRTLSFEASLELPIVEYSPQMESHLNNHVRANIKMKYRLE